ncbi:tyrosine-type recombinase/integrase [Nannocystis sp. ILAH1]|uniref:tyrosine-type recombinase/integrase n=1 Tax=Nannocystis sp. ILAH1 TaxID=2996789 RepID=UPI002270759E|nr:tyrosine-type recombinase/integrase [Nannocystis sp. ILAH1]
MADGRLATLPLEPPRHQDGTAQGARVRPRARAPEARSRTDRQPQHGYVLRTSSGKRLRSINRTWENIRAAAGIPDVRLHHLRHSCASDAIMSGASLSTVGKLLGRKQERTTKRYTHLADDYVRNALETATDRIVEAVQPIAALPPAPFEPMRDARWKTIEAMVTAVEAAASG